MFSLLGRCEGERGSAKNTLVPTSDLKCASPESSLPRSQVAVLHSCTGSVVIDAVSATFIAAAPYLSSAGPFFTYCFSPQPGIRGRGTRSVKRLLRSTSVPIADLPVPMIRPPFQWLATARSSASAGCWLTTISDVTCPLGLFCDLAQGFHSARPVRRQATSSRLIPPLPSMSSDW